MSEISYRILEPFDCDDLRSLRLEALKNHPKAFTDRYETESTYPMRWFEGLIRNNIVIGAFVDSKLRGMSILSPFKSKKQAHKATTWFTYVAPECRGMGIAKQIRLKTFEIARSKGIQYTVSGILSDNIPIQMLNKSLGCKEMYVEKNAIKEDDGTFHDVIHFIKNLNDDTDTQ